MLYPIIKKELKSYFDHATAYILLVIFLLFINFFYFRSAYIQGIASLQEMFSLLPWVLLFFAPAVTMRLISEERKSGTLDPLLSQPIPWWKLLFGKFLGASLFIFSALFFTISIPLSLSFFGSLDWGQVAAQYLSAALLIFCFVSIGIFSSALTKNQVVSFMIALAISFFFIISGFEVVTISLPAFFQTIFSRISLLSHFQNSVRGVIDIRDVVYFLSFLFAFLSLSYLFLIRPNANRKSAGFRKLEIGTAILVAIAILINLVGGYIPGRIDLTQARLYTLSDGTKKMLGSLEDTVTIKFVSSENLPPEIDPLSRDVKDLLRDLSKASKGKVRVEQMIIKEGDEELKEEVRAMGIVPMRFQKMEQEEFSLQQKYFGLAVFYADKKEVIPFLDSSSDLEYRLAVFIRGMTSSVKKKIGFLTGHGEKNASEFSIFRLELEKEHEVVDVDLKEKEMLKYPDIDTLVIARVKEEISKEEREAIQKFSESGGKIFFLIDTLEIQPQVLSATPIEHSFSDFLEQYGVKVKKDLVFDLSSSEAVSYGGERARVLVKYPFFPKAFPASGNPITGNLQTITFAWPSSLEILQETVEKNGIEAIRLIETTEFSGTQEDSFAISPEQQIPVDRDELSVRLLSAAIQPSASQKESNASQAPFGRMVVVGDSDFLSDQFVQGGGSENLIFGLNAVSWLAEDESLIHIRSKNRIGTPLVFKDAKQKKMVRYFNLVGVPVLVIIFGVIHLYRRRKSMKEEYRV